MDISIEYDPNQPPPLSAALRQPQQIDPAAFMVQRPDDARLAALRNQQMIGQLGMIGDIPGVQKSAQSLVNSAANELDPAKRASALSSAMKAQADIKKASLPNVKGETDLRKEFDKQVKTFSTINENWKRMQSAWKEPTGASDMALVFSYMKMLDPTSTVREGEAASVQNTASVPQTVRNMWNNVLTGQKLPEAARRNLMDTSSRMYESSLEEYQNKANQYKQLAGGYGLQPQNVVLPMAMAQTLDFERQVAEPELPAAKPKPAATSYTTPDGARYELNRNTGKYRKVGE